MKNQRNSDKNKEYFRLITVLILFLSAVIFSEEIRNAVGDALRVCLDTLVPSLFPMLFISSLFSFLSFPDKPMRIIEKPMMKLFGLSGNSFLPLFLSLTQGFPIAAKTALSYNSNGRITEEEARTIALCFTCPGLSFSTAVTGRTVFGSTAAGYTVLISCILSDILLCILLKKHTKTSAPAKLLSFSAEKISFSEMMIRSCNSASSAITGICSWVMLFSVISAVLKKLIPAGFVSDILTVFSEVTEAVLFAGRKKDLPLAAFSSAFGGLCIFCQLVPEIMQLGISPWIFLLIRFTGGLFSYITEKMILKLIPLSLSAAAQSFSASLSARSATGAASLMLLCLIFMFSLTNDNKNESLRIKNLP